MRPCIKSPVGGSPCGLCAGRSSERASKRATAWVERQPSPVSAQKSNQKFPSPEKCDGEEKSKLASKSDRSNGSRAAISSRRSNIFPKTVASATLMTMDMSRTGSYQPVIFGRDGMIPPIAIHRRRKILEQRINMTALPVRSDSSGPEIMDRTIHTQNVDEIVAAARMARATIEIRHDAWRPRCSSTLIYVYAKRGKASVICFIST